MGGGKRGGSAPPPPTYQESVAPVRGKKTGLKVGAVQGDAASGYSSGGVQGQTIAQVNRALAAKGGKPAASGNSTSGTGLFTAAGRGAKDRLGR